MTPLMTNDTVLVLLPRGGIFHANQSGGGLRP